MFAWIKRSPIEDEKKMESLGLKQTFRIIQYLDWFTPKIVSWILISGSTIQTETFFSSKF